MRDRQTNPVTQNNELALANSNEQKTILEQPPSYEEAIASTSASALGEIRAREDRRNQFTSAVTLYNKGLEMTTKFNSWNRSDSNPYHYYGHDWCDSVTDDGYEEREQAMATIAALANSGYQEARSWLVQEQANLKRNTPKSCVVM
jgi:hypothetical protein